MRAAAIGVGAAQPAEVTERAGLLLDALQRRLSGAEPALAGVDEIERGTSFVDGESREVLGAAPPDVAVDAATDADVIELRGMSGVADAFIAPGEVLLGCPRTLR